MEVGNVCVRWGALFLSHLPPPFPSWCRTHPVIFPTQVKQELCERRLGEHCSVGFGGFFKAKNKRGLPFKLLLTLGLATGAEMVL